MMLFCVILKFDSPSPLLPSLKIEALVSYRKSYGFVQHEDQQIIFTFIHIADAL